ncbi:MAG: WbqC family protein [Candidatus Delongbacteria bacterium]|jgi:hypothetical protein|nr:WbqC family protein [Candidatus Delongbacteria bacterium]
MTKVLLNTAYFPPIEYIQQFSGSDDVYIEACEHYVKQSYRNRCRISAPNGIQNLIVPVVKGKSPGQPIRDIKIDYSEPWQGNHRRSIETAYAAAPFFEFYYEEILPFFKQKYRFLFDLNLNICEKLITLFDLDTAICLTTKYTAAPSKDFKDLRDKLHPKKNMITKQTPYMQVFSERHGFQPGLSALDLLFNEGPASKTYLSG